MQQPQAEWVWLDARQSVSVAELSRVCEIGADELDELVEYGALAPLAQPAQPASVPQEAQFSADCVVPLRAACKLRIDYDLDLFTVALLMGYLNRIDGLERQLQSLRAELPQPRAR